MLVTQLKPSYTQSQLFKSAMGKRGNLGSNVSDESWRGQRWEERDRGSQHRSSQHRSSQHSHTAAQSGGGRHWGSQHWDKQDGTPPHHPKPKRVHTPALIKLEAGDVTSASGMVLQAHLTRGLQLEQDMKDAKQSFNAAQASRAWSWPQGSFQIRLQDAGRPASRDGSGKTVAPTVGG